MKTLIPAVLFLFIATASLAQSAIDSKQEFASIGDFKLESGNTISGCNIGYRTYGRLNSAKNNGILFLTWFGGNAKNVEATNPFLAVDTMHYFLITVDALGDGVSSSPSNSIKQHGINFPGFSIRDMVESQYQLLTKNLGIAHVHAIMGISMGGIQTFQWAVSYPDFTDELIPIVGSPQPSSYDLMLYNTYLSIIEADSAYNHGNYTVNPNITSANMLWELFLTTPANWVKSMSHNSFPNWMVYIKGKKSGDWNDSRYQITAVIGQDISKPYNGSLKETASHIKGKMLIISSQQDHMVNPDPAIEFSKLLPAKMVVINSELGHLAPGFNDPEVKNSIIEMLGEN